MKKYTFEANAKINLGLNIVGKLENGYHLLDMIMLPVNLSDEMIITVFENENENFNSETLIIKTNKKDIPTDKKNILFKVYNKFYEVVEAKNKINRLNLEINLEKKIPHEAGLGGGSSDGATLLNFLNSYHDNILSREELIDLGKKIGADIPFFIINKPARIGGIGEKILEIENNLDSMVAIIKPKFGVSTELAYKNVKKIEEDIKKKASIDEIVLQLKKGNINWIQNKDSRINNELEEALLGVSKEIFEFRNRLENFEVNEKEKYRFFMSGSGSAYYCFIDNEASEVKSFISKITEVFNDCEVFFCDFK